MKENQYFIRLVRFFSDEFGVSVGYNVHMGEHPSFSENKIGAPEPGRDIIPLFSLSSPERDPYLAFYSYGEYKFGIQREDGGSYDAYICRDPEVSTLLGLKFAVLIELADCGVFGFHALTMTAGAPGGPERVIMLSAPSGTGKTTHGEFWRKQFGARIINGDYAFLEVKRGNEQDDGVPCGGTYFRGTPFRGSSKYAEPGTWRVDDIVFLRQADYNRAERLGGREAYKNLLQNSFVPFWDAKKSGAVQELIMETINNVRVWRLDCKPEPEAAQVLHDALFIN